MRISATGVALLLTLTLALDACDSGDDDTAAPPATDGPTSSSAEPLNGLSTCPEDPAWECGSIEVPLDRAQPNGRQVELSFAVLRHPDDQSSATDALFATDGGPGVANIANRDFLEYIAGDLTDDRDLVLIDHRGTGKSGAIDCPRLQESIGDLSLDVQAFVRTVGACGRQLGPDSDRYGSGDVAMDMEAVREALGYESIDLYGMSYGAVFVSAYATRYPERLRAVVIDAGVPVSDPRHSWTWGVDLPPRLAEVVALDCARFEPCAAKAANPETALARLASHVRRHPVVGTIEPTGAARERVVVDERELAAQAWSQPNRYLFALAADALDKGDEQPLLDIVEGARQDPWTPEEPDRDSAGDNVAVFCNDQDFVWDRDDPSPLRRAKYHKALRSTDPDVFAPFSAATWTDVFAADLCRLWPAPDRFTPAVERGATATAMPVLILSGDMDTDVPTRTSRELLRIFPDASFVEVSGASHPVSGSSPCGQEAMQEFVRSLRAPAADPCA